MSEAKRKSVVIVGGGYAGVAVLKKLGKLKNIRITLIEQKEVHQLAVAAPRALVDEQIAKDMFVPFDGILNGAKHVRGRVESVDFKERKIKLVDAEKEVKYDFLILATGLTYAAPFRFGDSLSGAEEMLSHIHTDRKAIEKAKTVVVVGGGPTGIETAAEIREYFPDKKKQVILVHSHSRLAHNEPLVTEAHSAEILKKLEQMDIEVQLDTRWDFEKEHNKTFVVRCTSGTPNTGFLDEKFLDDAGFVKTTEFLTLPKFSNVFAIGDIVSGYRKTVGTASFHHPPVVAKNIRLALADKPMKPIAPLPGWMNMSVIVLGKKSSIKIGLVGKMAGGMKQKDFMVGSNRKKFGARKNA